MTDKQIQQALNELGSWRDDTPEKAKKREELDCRNMINSCLAYGEAYGFYNVNTGEWGEYAQDYLRKLGAEKCFRLFMEQRDEFFEKATVEWGVYEDFEGCTYNRVTWGDEDE